MKKRKYWLLRQVFPEDACRLYEFYTIHDVPAIVFNNVFDPMTMIIGAYADDELHTKAREETGAEPIEDYTGIEKLIESLKMHPIIASNAFFVKWAEQYIGGLEKYAATVSYYGDS